MTPKEIIAKFAHVLDNFNLITGEPSNTNLTGLREAIAPLLLQILYEETGAVHNPIGLIWLKAAYVARYGEAFPESKRVRAYDTNIDDDSRAVVHARLEAAHKAKRADRATFESARRETTKLVFAIVADTWVRELRDTESLYTKVVPEDFFSHLKWGAPYGTPLTSWHCITKSSATTSRSRVSPSILICSRTPNGKPAGLEEQSRTRPYSSSQVLLC